MIYVGSLGFFRCCRFDFLGVVAPVTPNEFPNVVEPVINYYRQSNLLRVINGEAGISEINTEISGLIEGIKG